MEPLLIRQAEPADLAALRVVFRRSSLANPSHRASLLANPDALEFTGESIPAGRTRVAVVDGGIVGFASTTAGEAEWELDDLFVDPDRMRRGVGLALVRDVIALARKGGVRRIMVTANPDAMAFYTRAGFVRDGDAETRFGPAPRLRLDL